MQTVILDVWLGYYKSYFSDQTLILIGFAFIFEISYYSDQDFCCIITSPQGYGNLCHDGLIPSYIPVSG